MTLNIRQIYELLPACFWLPCFNFLFLNSHIQSGLVGIDDDNRRVASGQLSHSMN